MLEIIPNALKSQRVNQANKKAAPIERSGRETHKLDFVEIFSVIVDKVQHFY
jgi:hypothetical protein